MYVHVCMSVGEAEYIFLFVCVQREKDLSIEEICQNVNSDYFYMITVFPLIFLLFFKLYFSIFLKYGYYAFKTQKK